MGCEMLKTRIKNLNMYFFICVLLKTKKQTIFWEGGIREKVSLAKKLSFFIPLPLMRLSFFNKNLICIYCIRLERSNSTK